MDNSLMYNSDSPGGSHEFHFVVNKVMKERLKELGLYVKSGSLSGVIKEVLKYLAPVIKREHDWGSQRISRYMLVSEPGEGSVHVHAYFPQELYREIKVLHADVDSFSIAQLVRGFLGFFILLEDEYGDRVLEELEKMYKGWDVERKANRLTCRQMIRQFKRIIQHIPKETGLVTIYNKDFAPFWIMRL